MNQIRNTSSVAISSFSFRNDYFKILIISLIYFLSHQLAFFFPDSGKVIMLIWPAGGISLAAFLLCQRRLWPALTIAFMISGILADVFLAQRSFTAGLGYMTANMVESISVAWLIKYFSKDFQKFGKVREVLALIAGVLLLNALSACIGAGTSVLTRGVPFSGAWQSWYVSDGLGLLMVGPFIIVWFGNTKVFISELSSGKILEGFACIIIWAAFSIIIFYPVQNSVLMEIHPYLLIALIAWPALRFGQKGTTIALMILFIISISSPAILKGPSPWSNLYRIDDISVRLIELQLFLGFLAITGYLIAAGYYNLNRAEKSLMESDERFRLIFENTSEAILFTEPTGKIYFVNQECCKIFGYTNEEFQKIGRNGIIDLSDTRFPIALTERNTTGKFKGELNFVKKDGTVFPAEITTNIFVNSEGVVMSSIILKDISERKLDEEKLMQSESELLRAEEIAKYGNWNLNLTNNIIKSSDGARIIYGLESNENPLKDIQNLVLPEFRNELDNAFYGMINNEKSYDVEFKICRKSDYNIIDIHSRAEYDPKRKIVFGTIQDITERKQAEEALNKKTQELDNYFTNALDLFCIANTDGYFLKLNKEWENTLGYKLEELEGIKFLDLVHPDDFDATLKSISELSDQKKILNFTNRFRTAKGDYRNIEWRSSPSGNLIYAAARDITEQKKADTALRDSEEKFRNLFNNSEVGMFRTRLDGLEILEFNQKYLEILKYTHDELKGKPSVDFWVDKYERARMVNILKSEGYVRDFKFELFNKYGEIRKCITSLKLYPEQDILEGSITDITERMLAESSLKESEEKFSKVFYINPSACGLSDLDDHTYVEVNEAFYTLFGYNKDEVIGKTAYDLGLFTQEEAIKIMAKADINGRLTNIETELKARNGDIKHVLLSAENFYIQDKKYRYTVVNDITERKLAEEAMRESEEKFRLLAEHTTETVWLMDFNLNTTYISPSVEKQRGYTFEEIKQIPLDKNITPESFSLAMNAFSEEMARLKEDPDYSFVRTLDLEFYRKDGTTYFSESTFSLLRDENGIPFSILSEGRDITERKKAEEALRLSEEKFRSIFNNHSAIKLLIDPENGNIVDANQSASNYYGWTIDELKYKNVKEINTLSANEVNNNIDNIINEQRTHFEFQHKLKDGSIRDVEVFSSKINISGKNILHSIIHDITDKKLAEEAIRINEQNLQTLFNAINESICLMNPDGIILTTNRTFAARLQRIPADCIGRSIYEFAPPDMANKRKLFVDSVIKTGIPVTFEDKNNGRWTSHNVWPVIEDNGTISRIVIFAIDITKRRQAEKMFQDIVDKNPMSIQILDMDGYTIQTNSAHTKLFGAKTPSGYSILNDTKLLQQGLGVLFDDIKKGEVVFFPDSNFNVHDIDPSFPNVPVWIKAIGFTLNDNYGIPEKIVIMHENITERKIAEKMLKDIIDKNPMSIQIVDKDGFTLQGNPSYLRLFGAFPPPFFSIFDDLSSKSQELKKLILLAKSGQIVNLPNMYYNPHDVSPDFPNKPVWIRAIIFPLNDINGESDRYVIMHENITESKQAEEELLLSESRYRFLFENMMDGYIHCRMLYQDDIPVDYEVISVNPAYEKMTGLKDITGKKISDVIPNYCIDNMESLIVFGRVAKTGKPERFEHYLAALEKWFSFAVYSPGEDQFVAVFDNITERKQSELLLQEQNRKIELQYEEYIKLNEILRLTNYNLGIEKARAEESDKLKTAFLQNMSHEIRTPLNGIIGFSNLLGDEELTQGEIKEYTRIIQLSGERLIEIVNNVLDISKIETGQIEIKSKAFSLNTLLLDLHYFFSPVATAKGLILNCHTTPDDKISIINTDETKLNQILTNLINNSIKFTMAGSIDFGYNIKDSNILFYVKDTGIGITEEFHERIFDRFVQAELSISRGYEGAGLGLAICKGLVELLGGRIWVESKINKGTTFYFSLPYIHESNMIYLDKNLPANNIEHKKFTILIAEDDWTSFKYLSTILKNDNIKIIHAEDGQQAVDNVRNNQDIDLVLLDIKMPVMDGIEATKQIKFLRPELPIIAQTAFAFSSEKEEILSVGCNDYISKPILKAALLKLLEKYIN